MVKPNVVALNTAMSTCAKAVRPLTSVPGFLHLNSFCSISMSLARDHFGISGVVKFPGSGTNTL